MTAKTRRRFLAASGLVPSIPAASLRRTWEWIDDRVKPLGEPDGEFISFETWVNKASSWIGYTGAKCYDAKGRPCRSGADMERAKKEGVFPVAWYFPHHFPTPKIPTKGEIEAIKHLREKELTTIHHIRALRSCSTMTIERIEKVLGEGSIHREDALRFGLTPKGKEEASFIADRERRASYV